MPELDWLARRFAEDRPRLWGVAYHILGSTADAEDAVQESWIRLSGASPGEIDNLGGWLTTVVARVCLNMLRARRRRPEELPGEPLALHAEPVGGEDDPEEAALLADSVGLALLVLLERLTPSERIALVLHDVFALPFEEIAPIVDRSPGATRQLASRARRRVRATPAEEPSAGADRAIVDAFLAAARGGDFTGLLELLAPDVVLSTDPAAAAAGAPAALHGAREVATLFCGGAAAARRATIDGRPGVVWAHAGRVRVAFDFTTQGRRITRIHLLADPAVLAGLEVELLRRRE